MDESVAAGLPADEEENGTCVVVPIPSSDTVYVAIPSSSIAQEGTWVDLDCEGDQVTIAICREPSYRPFFAAGGPRQDVIAVSENCVPSLTPLIEQLLGFVDRIPAEYKPARALFHVPSHEAFTRIWDGDGDIEIPTRRVTGIPDTD
jgi:hypothetical protein